jgi:hypothetical protein
MSKHGVILSAAKDLSPALRMMQKGRATLFDQSPVMLFSLMTLNQRSCSLFW